MILVTVISFCPVGVKFSANKVEYVNKVRIGSGGNEHSHNLKSVFFFLIFVK